MKKTLFFTITLMFIANISLKSQSQVDTANYQHVSVIVDGLACPFCAYGLEKNIIKIDGAENVKIDVKKGILTFLMPKQTPITEKQVKDLVKDAGFTAREVTFSKEDPNSSDD